MTVTIIKKVDRKKAWKILQKGTRADNKRAAKAKKRGYTF